ncbi:LPD7 domain-containing protein [Candidatus Enterovibrio escicola]|uniref:LPD7 domain-containing protein n=2 Tax=Candidatus Enterovibrio escicola TaxID=1927127 RepID=UPI0016810650|nr:LPD7 domain-containing protein [Candidatus Enterovibrio escacola]
MLARVTNGKDGIVEYLENGIKSGRELSRNELDKRICIDGSLNVTDTIIKSLNKSNRYNNYLHITLSFGENDISRSDITKAYDDYKEKVMTAFHSDEYNIYAEIHLPKVKSYKHRRTNEIIERFPHVHIVIPLINIVSGKTISPFGKYTRNIDFHDSIQESINRKLRLESPYDHQRKYRIINDNAEFISRYKGDSFKGSNAEFKNNIFDMINHKNIRLMNDFEKELSSYGEVSKGKLGSNDEYLKVKLFGKSKYIRLKESCFNSDYIVDRQLLRPKPTDKQINNLVDEWMNSRSHEMKHIQQAPPRLREEYYSLKPDQREAFLHERRRDHAKKYHIGERRRTTNRKPRVERIGLKRFAEIRNGLPSMPQRGLVRANGERSEVSKSVLSSNANHHLESSRAGGDNQLRRTVNRSRGHGIGGRLQLKEAVSEILSLNPRTLSEQLLQDHVKERIVTKEIEHFRVVGRELDPKLLLQHFEKTHGLVPENYSTFRAKDGSARIEIASRAFTVNDFCIKHMNQSWGDTKTILSTTYQEQCNDLEGKSTIPELDHVAAAMTLAAEKFGSVKLTGTKAFKQQVIDVAIAKNLNIVFDSPKLQQMFIEQKSAHEQKQVTENKQDNIADAPVHSNEQQQNRGLDKEVEDDFIL